MIIYLDLDRTLLRTDALEELWDYLRTEYPHLADHMGRNEDYLRYVDDMSYYDFGAQLADMGLEPDVIYAELAESEYADGRYEYDGASELITSLRANGFELSVLTFGADDYQRFKASLCPSLAGMQIITTNRPKYDVLSEIAEDGCWLVDDRPIGDELPNNVSFVQVSQEGQPFPHDALWPIKQNLQEVKEFFEDVVS